jgi:hypothetical protein
MLARWTCGTAMDRHGNIVGSNAALRGVPLSPP